MEASTQVFSYKYCEIFKKNYFKKHLPTTAYKDALSDILGFKNCKSTSLLNKTVIYEKDMTNSKPYRCKQRGKGNVGGRVGGVK